MPGSSPAEDEIDQGPPDRDGAPPSGTRTKNGPLTASTQTGTGVRADLARDSADPGLREAVGKATGGAGLGAAFDFAGGQPGREQPVPVEPRAGRSWRA
ncbi:hypothetical protein ACWD00_02225 [Streptomyces viridiviolaceus]